MTPNDHEPDWLPGEPANGVAIFVALVIGWFFAAIGIALAFA